MNPREWRGAWHRALAVAASVAALAGCGGGGGDDDGGGGAVDILTVSVNYSGDAYLFESSTIRPQLNGFNGHSPRCSLASGRLPAGMTLNSDCSVAGIPEELGSFDFVVRIGASGVSNTIDYSTGFAVFGPSVLYTFPGGWALGDTVSVAPMNVFWTPHPGIAVSYRVVSGALPAGLALDAVTGRVSGTVRAVGTQHFRIGVTVTFNGKTASLAQDADNATSSSLAGSFYPDDLLALLGRPVDITPAPTLPAGATLQFAIDSVAPPGTPLPVGLAFDAATGRLSGAALKPQDRLRFAVTVRVDAGGVVSTQTLPLWIEARSPVIVFYGQQFRGVGSPLFVAAPSIYGNGVPTLTGATYTFRQNAGAPLPAGLVVALATGEITGMVSAPFLGRSMIDVHVVQGDGVTFDITVPIDLEIR